MATRSRIGIELSDGSVLSAYHHWDGYPEWLGRILTTHYNARSLAEELIDGGDMSCAWTDERWDDSGVKGVYGPQYYSARGDRDASPRLDSNLNEYLSNSEEYSYIFTKEGEWVCYTNDHRFPDVVKTVDIPSGALAV
jgi:hypothetical protein